jgi:hypothetical protein
LIHFVLLSTNRYNWLEAPTAAAPAVTAPATTTP